MNWFVYIVECKDKTLYTGISTDVEHRIKVHNFGKGAKYTSGRRPVILKYVEGPFTLSEALKQEFFIKRQKRSVKETYWKGIK
jgi:putative endonuclease